MARSESGATSVQVEIRSVNSRRVEVFVQGRDRLPPAVVAKLEEAVLKAFSRGKFDARIEIRFGASTFAAEIDSSALANLVSTVREAADRAGIGIPAPEWFFSKSEIWNDSGRIADVQVLLQDTWKAALGDLAADRTREGQALNGILRAIFEGLERLLADARRQSAQAADTIRDRIRSKIEEYLDEGRVDRDRVEQEIVHAAIRMDVSEELERLGAHLSQLNSLLQGSDEAVGRKLDFLAQEILRETNTMCSKSATTELSRTGLAMKELVDRLREQVQNVE